jgi:hypothetical protein
MIECPEQVCPGILLRYEYIDVSHCNSMRQMAFNITSKKIGMILATACIFLSSFVEISISDTGKSRQGNVRTPGMYDRAGIDRHAVGVILPLSGQNAFDGNKTLDALLLASGVFDTSKKNPIKMVIEDSRSNPAAAKIAVDKLADVDKVICIVGALGQNEDIETASEILSSKKRTRLLMSCLIQNLSPAFSWGAKT